MHEHHYHTSLEWTGNQGQGTSSYQAYSRNHIIRAAGKADIAGSSDPGFRGDPSRYNPEDMLVASLSACHMLWYLHLCAVAGVVVTAYADEASGVMAETAHNGGHFTSVTLHPRVTVANAAMKEKALALHADAHHHCFVANSCNFPVLHEAEIVSDNTLS